MLGRGIRNFWGIVSLLFFFDKQKRGGFPLAQTKKVVELANLLCSTFQRLASLPFPPLSLYPLPGTPSEQPSQSSKISVSELAWNRRKVGGLSIRRLVPLEGQVRKGIIRLLRG